ncbi:MAG TPA: hypothetical protein PLM79_17935 [Syntrophobacteraceae bacterium]|nr:hypothetical protein [Syntrophobacteraceae bacterium]
MKTLLSRQSSNLRSFINELGFGSIASFRKAARALQAYVRERKKATDPLCEVTVTCGAQWASNHQGYWYLLKANGSEKETAVRELLEHFGLPEWFVLQDGHEKGRLSQLATLVEFGMELPVEHLKRSCDAEGGAAQREPSIETDKEC